MISSLKDVARKCYYRFVPTPEYAGTTIDNAFPEAEKTVLRESRDVPIPDADAIPFPQYLDHLPYLGGTYRTPTVSTCCLEDVLLCPDNNVALTQDFEIIAETVGPGMRADYVNNKTLWKNKKRIERIEGVCTPLRSHYTAYSHFLLDELPRFNVLNHDYFRQFEEIKVLCSGGLHSGPDAVDQNHAMTDEAFFLDRLAPSNVTFVPLERGRLYSLEKYLFLPFVTKRGSWYLPQSYVSRFRSRVCPSVERGGSNDRLYIARSKAPRRRILNEGELSEELASLGFETHHTEDYHPEKQRRLFKNAEVIVMPHGSGIANLLYADHAKVLVIYGTEYTFPHNYFLCKSLGHEYQYMCGNRRDPDGNFTVDPAAVTTRVEEMMGSPPRGAPDVTAQTKSSHD